MASLIRYLELPFPPSAEHYWQRVGPRTLLSREGRRYREQVVRLLTGGRSARLRGRIALMVHVFAPNRRRHALDEVQEAVCDALQRAGVYKDDRQIDRIEVHRGPTVVPGGKVVVEIFSGS